MPDNHFDGWVAASYDAAEADMYEPDVLEPTVDFLAELAGAGPALEFAIGTGRVGLPLRRRGIEVHGIEFSEAMLEQLRSKPGGEAIPVTVGDMATTSAGGRFALVYLVFNTILNLTTQDAQVECFANAARHLEPGGSFVVEVIVPDVQRLPLGETVRAYTVSADHLGFDEIDIATQQAASHHHYRLDGAWRSTRMPYRYAWPAELDLMARLAGMTLRERWGGWDRSAFTAESRSHVSVWEKPA